MHSAAAGKDTLQREKLTIQELLCCILLYDYLSLSMHAVIGHFSGLYSPT